MPTKELLNMIDEVNNTYGESVIYYMANITDNCESETITYENLREMIVDAENVRETNRGIYFSCMFECREKEYMILFPYAKPRVA